MSKSCHDTSEDRPNLSALVEAHPGVVWLVGVREFEARNEDSPAWTGRAFAGIGRWRWTVKREDGTEIHGRSFGWEDAAREMVGAASVSTIGDRFAAFKAAWFGWMAEDGVSDAAIIESARAMADAMTDGREQFSALVDAADGLSGDAFAVAIDAVWEAACEIGK